MRLVIQLLLLTLAVIATRFSWKFSSSVAIADVIVTNARIWTANTKMPWAESMAISKGKILAVGSASHVQKVAGLRTKYLDLEGKFVAPGFIDSHVHLIPGGLQMGKLDLRGVASRSEFEERIKQSTEGLADGAWLLGSGWSNENWGGEWPTSSWIDHITEKHPVWLVRIDGHMGLANLVALKKCQISEQLRSVPDGGTLATDTNGVPTGLLVDAAMELISGCLPRPSIQLRRDALIRASKLALSKGVTTVVDFGSFFPGSSTEQVWDDFYEVYKWTDAIGDMLIRAVVFLPLQNWERVASLVRERGHFISSWLRIGGVKDFFDGSLGSSTALFLQPYEDDEVNYGLQLSSLYWFNSAISGAVQSNLQVAVHAIGDAANDQLLSIFENIAVSRSQRIRIEHAQHLSPGAHKRFAKAGVIASMQPEHLLDDATYAARKLGEERTAGAFNLHSLLSNGSIVTMGSDWPVASVDPLMGMRAAVKRIPYGWKHAWTTTESISIDDALAGYTTSAAYSCFMEHLIGSLSVGKFGDFVILSDSPETIANDDHVQVMATYVGGIEMYNFHG